ncbi:hypothetical protein [Rufibacter sp. LB8]|uniref:hypothetical protein n=1 Tax=Rufibacter sp. LB8 TaxID=2777781 RepID=UPI00178C3201|nr:hypothetical protein [Rufibacter sp. LB8]
MREELKFLFTNVNDWLKFIEAKNTALIALNGAIMIGLIQCVNDSIKNPIINYFIVYWLVPWLLLSLSISLISVTGWSIWFSGRFKKKRLKSKNVLYFGYISSISYNTFKIKLHQTLNTGNSQQSTSIFSKVDSKLIGQIHVNSKIAFGKNRLFHYALYISIFGLISSIAIIQTLRWSENAKKIAEQYLDFNHLKDNDSIESPSSIQEINIIN